MIPTRQSGQSVERTVYVVMKKTVYVIIPLTQVNTIDGMNMVKKILQWITDKFDVEILMWAFDLQTWTPKAVPNIYEYDKNLVLKADLAIAFFLNLEGSDGRGGEIVLRTEAQKPILAFAYNGVKVSRFVSDCLVRAGAEIQPFEVIEDTFQYIKMALDAIPTNVAEQVEFKGFWKERPLDASILPMASIG